MFKKPEDIQDDFETSFKARAVLRKSLNGGDGKEVDITVERKRRSFFVNGERVVLSQRSRELIFCKKEGVYTISDGSPGLLKPIDQILKDLRRGWFLPEHRICAKNVDFPTIRVAELGDEGEEKEPWVCIQWFGVAKNPLLEEACIPDGSQFLFSMNCGIGPLDEAFGNNPESFRVVFLGQAKNWLNPDSIQSMIDGPGEGNPEAWFAWLLSSKVTFKENGRLLPASPLLEPDLLGDPNCGIIVPKPFGDLRIRDGIMADF